MRSRKIKSAPVGVIGKLLAVLELLDQSPGGLQLREISERTGINKSTAHRLVSHLEAEDYLFRDALGTYMVGPKLTRLGSGGSFQATLAKLCRPVLENLRKITGETINLGVLDGADVLYIDVLETHHTFRLVSGVGTRRPFYCTSLGKAILANVEDEQKKENLFSSIHFEASTPRTINGISRLKKQLTVIRKVGYSLDDEEAVAGIRCLGAAIRDREGEVVGAISVSGPVVRLTTDKLPLFSQELCKAAREISWMLGSSDFKSSSKSRSK